MEHERRVETENPSKTASWPAGAGSRRRLDSWKEIGAYLSRDARTVQRWEKTLGLPVHRQLSEKAGSVYAYTDQLDVWRESRERPALSEPPQPEIDSTPPKPARRWSRQPQLLAWSFLLLLLAGAGILLLRWWPRPEPAAAFRLTPFTSLMGSELLPSFSPNGKQVAFSWSPDELHFGIYIKSLADGHQSTIVPAGSNTNASPAWSPDGARLAYLSGSFSGPTRLCVKDLRSGATHEIVSSGAGLWPWFGALAWMPDGQHIVTAGAVTSVRESSLVLVSLKDRTAARLTAAPDGFADVFPAVSPDGKELLFTRVGGGLARLFRMPLDGSKRIEPILPKQARDTPGAMGVWGSNGVVFAQIQRSGASEFWRLDRFGRATLLAVLPGVVNGFAVNRDGTLVLSRALMDINLWSFSFDEKGVPGPPHRCDQLISTLNESNPRYSPDGRRMAFESDRSGHPEIWVANRDGAGAAALTHFNGPVTGSPAWSPDGRWIAFDSRLEGHPAIFIISSAGGSPKRITEGKERDVIPSWSNDGKRIYFASPAAGDMQIWSVRIDGSERTQITKRGGFFAQESADGHFLYYTQGHNAITTLKRVPVSGGAEVIVAASVLDRCFALTRRGIYFASAPVSAPKLEFLEYNQFTPTILTVFPKPIKPGFAVSPGAHELMYAQTDTSGADLDLVHGVR